MSVGRVLHGDSRFLLRHCVSAVGRGRCASRRVNSTDPKWERSCTVDRNKEEEFVFVDYTGEERGLGETWWSRYVTGVYSCNIVRDLIQKTE